MNKFVGEKKNTHSESGGKPHRRVKHKAAKQSPQHLERGLVDPRPLWIIHGAHLGVSDSVSSETHTQAHTLLVVIVFLLLIGPSPWSNSRAKCQCKLLFTCSRRPVVNYLAPARSCRCPYRSHCEGVNSATCALTKAKKKIGFVNFSPKFRFVFGTLPWFLKPTRGHFFQVCHRELAKLCGL